MPQKHVVVLKKVAGVALAIVGFFMVPSTIAAFLVGVPMSATGQFLIICAFMPIFPLFLSDKKWATGARIVACVVGFILLGLDKSPLPNVQNISNPTPIFIGSSMGWILFAYLYLHLHKKKKS